jgi:hypothetical protein
MRRDINEFLTLELRGGRVVILVDGEPFRTCKFLVMNISKDAVWDYDEADSIDEAVEIYEGRGRKRLESRKATGISPKEEFWGHYSNLQAWAERGYDLRLLHSSLGIPLARRLVEAGEGRALPALRREVMRLLRRGRVSTLLMHIEKGTFDLLEPVERETALRDLAGRIPEFVGVERARSIKLLLSLLEERYPALVPTALDGLARGLENAPARALLDHLNAGSVRLIPESRRPPIWSSAEELAARDELSMTRLGLVKHLKSFSRERAERAASGIVRKMCSGDLGYIRHFARRALLSLLSLEDLERIFEAVPASEQSLLRRIQKLKNERWILDRTIERTSAGAE